MIQQSEINDSVIRDSGVILLADGNRDDVDLTLRAFEKAGLRNRVVVARDGFETLDHLFRKRDSTQSNGGVMPGLVMLDLKLSRLSGLDVLRRMRSNELTRYLPVVVLISSEGQREVLEGYGLKADGYVCKPVDLARLKDEMSKLDFDWLVENAS